MANQIPCDVLTGFLGSGKSTLLNAFLRQQTEVKVAVIVNEFGSIGIDQLSFQEVIDDVYLLDSGCLCCSITHSLSETLLDINNVQRRSAFSPLQRVIIETSGLADPIPIMNVLLGDRNLRDYFRLGHVITTVDAVQGAEQLHNHREALRQVAAAEKVVITKVDQVGRECSSKLRHILGEINPTATITESSKGDAGATIFSVDPALNNNFRWKKSKDFRLNSSLLPRANDTMLVPHAGIRSWGVFFEERATWPGVSAWWNLIVHKYGNGLLRCKGLLKIANPDQSVLIQGVGKVFHTPQVLKEWPDSDPRCRLVCIGSDLDDDWLLQSMRALTITEPSCRPLTLEEIDQCI